MGHKSSEDIKGGIRKPKKSKPSTIDVTHATAKANSKASASNKKQTQEIKDGAPVPPSIEKTSKKSKGSFEIDGLFGQLRGATTAAAKSKVR